MNYLTEIKMFYDWLETHNLSAKGIVIWHGLMQIASRAGWKTPLEIPSSTLEMRTHLERTAIFRERNNLVAAGLIRLCQKGGRSRCAYTLISFSERVALHSATQNETQSDVVMLQDATQVPRADDAVVLHSGTQTDTKNDAVVLQDATQSGEEPQNSDDVVLQVMLHNETQSATQNEPILLSNIKTKLNNKENNKRKMEVADKSAPLPTNSPEKKEKSCAKKESKAPSLFDPERWLTTLDAQWQELMRQWLEYKAARRQTYKAEIGAAKCFAQLRTLSGNNIRTAQAIIDRSMANNWSGLFALQPSNGSRGQPDYNTPQHGQRIGQIVQPEDEAKRQRILERYRNAGKTHKTE